MHRIQRCPEDKQERSLSGKPASTTKTRTPSLLGKHVSSLQLARHQLPYQCAWEPAPVGDHWHLSAGDAAERGAESLNFSALRTLTRLDLSHNLLTGSIPPSIEVLGELCALLLQGNQIRGSIPVGIGNLTKLCFLMLHENDVSGGIPRQIGNMSSLVTLNLSNNHLVGDIPCEVGHLKHLVLC